MRVGNNMSKAEFTPGPWHHHDMEAMTVCGPDHSGVALTDCRHRTVAENEANANLIIAAPDLLAAAKCALADLEGAIERSDLGDEGVAYDAAKLTIKELRAAIAKTKGGA